MHKTICSKHHLKDKSTGMHKEIRHIGSFNDCRQWKMSGNSKAIVGWKVHGSVDEPHERRRICRPWHCARARVSFSLAECVSSPVSASAVQKNQISSYVPMMLLLALSNVPFHGEVNP